MAAVKGKKGRRPNIHLLQEPQAGARPPSALCSAPSSGFVGGLSDWVGPFNSPSPYQRQEHDSNIIPVFFMPVLKLLVIVWILFLFGRSRGAIKTNAAYLPKSMSHRFL